MFINDIQSNQREFVGTSVRVLGTYAYSSRVKEYLDGTK